MYTDYDGYSFTLTQKRGLGSTLKFHCLPVVRLFDVDFSRVSHSSSPLRVFLSCGCPLRAPPALSLPQPEKGGSADSSFCCTNSCSKWHREPTGSGSDRSLFTDTSSTCSAVHDENKNIYAVVGDRLGHPVNALPLAHARCPLPHFGCASDEVLRLDRALPFDNDRILAIYFQREKSRWKKSLGSLWKKSSGYYGRLKSVPTSNRRERLQFNGGRLKRRLVAGARALLFCAARRKAGGKAETLRGRSTLSTPPRSLCRKRSPFGRKRPNGWKLSVTQAL